MQRAALLILAASLSCSPQSHDGGIVRVSIATGDTGGVFYRYGGGGAKVIGEHIPDVEATAEVTGASVDNLKFIRDRKADLAFTTADTLDDESTAPVHSRTRSFQSRVGIAL